MQKDAEITCNHVPIEQRQTGRHFVCLLAPQVHWRIDQYKSEMHLESIRPASERPECKKAMRCRRAKVRSRTSPGSYGAPSFWRQCQMKRDVYVTINLDSVSDTEPYLPCG